MPNFNASRRKASSCWSTTRPMTIDWVKSLPKATTIASCRVLARMAIEYAMPLVLTTTMEDYVGPTIPDISDLAPDAFARRYKRGGELRCWDAADLRDGVAALGRRNIVLAGLTTDICLFWAAVKRSGSATA